MKLTVNLPGSIDGADVEVPGLGVFANGAEHDVDDARVEEAVASGMQPEELLQPGAELILVEAEPEVQPTGAPPVDPSSEGGA